MTHNRFAAPSTRPAGPRRFTAVILVAAVVCASAGILLAKSPKMKKAAQTTEDKKGFSVEAILDPSLPDVMHEIFRHYIAAGTSFGTKDYRMAVTHLDIVMGNIDLIPDRLPDEDKDGKPLDRADVLKKHKGLKDNMMILRTHIAKKRYKKASAMAPEKVTQMCLVCHKSVKVPPPWPLDEE